MYEGTTVKIKLSLYNSIEFACPLWYIILKNMPGPHDLDFFFFFFFFFCWDGIHWKKTNKARQNFTKLHVDHIFCTKSLKRADSTSRGGALPKNMWRVCAATLTPIFKPPVTEWPPFLFFTFCSHLMTPIFKMLSHLMTPFFRNIYRWKWASCSHWMTLIFTNKWPPRDMYPNFFGRRNSCYIEFCTKIESLTKWPPFFFFKLKSSLKDPFFFIVLTKWPPIFLLSSLKDPLFSLFSLSPKDPYFGGRVRTYPSLPYVSAPPPPSTSTSILYNFLSNDRVGFLFLFFEFSTLSKLCVKSRIISRVKTILPCRS